MAALESTGKPVRYEKEMIGKSGNRISVELLANILCGKSGKPQYHYAFINDITERKKAMTVLKESEQRYRTLFDSATEGIIIVDVETKKFIHANPAICALFGYSQEELTRMSVSDIHPKTSLEHIFAEFDAQARGEKILASAIPCLKKDGTIFYADINNTRATVDGRECNIGFFTDVTARKQAEEQIAHLASFPEFNPDSVIELYLDGSVSYSNPVTTSLFPDLESLGTRHPYLVDWQTTMSQLMALGTNTLDREVRVEDSYYIQTIQYIESLKAIRIYGRNITERKHAEEENQLLREKAEISTRLAAIGEMAAGIAHEINNPLTSVIGFSELLMEENLPQEIKAQLKIISDGSHRVKDIVRRMLTFSRQTKPIKACVDINDLIDATLDLRSYVLRTANIEVVKHFDPDLHCVVADAGQMQQVFLNLIVNAEYSMKKAHGRGNLTITTEKADDHVHILFKDDGTGMTQAIKEKVFNPFFTTKEVDEGTGLGLALTRSIILEHNGTIEVESEPGQGATLIITLPITPPTETVQDKAGAVAQIPTNNVRAAHILVIDDEYAIRKLMSTILSKSGHTVETTGDAREALVKMDSTSYDAVLVDIRMPGMSGIELYNDVKMRRPELSGRFIFITADILDENTKAFFKKNELSYINKPFDRETLIKKVNDLLQFV